MRTGARTITIGTRAVWRLTNARWLSVLVAVSVLGSARAEFATSLTTTQRAKLIHLVQTDADAAKLFKRIQSLAESALGEPPQPSRQIATAGRLAADPAKVESRSALEDMKKVEALGFAYVVASNTACGDAARRIVLGWARTYEPSGSPIDETKLEPLFVAYGLTSGMFSAEDKHLVEKWLRAIAAQQLSSVRVGSVTASNNWNSHRLKIVGLVGFLLEDRALIERAMNGFKQQIADNLRPDGASLDFHERDALHYHCYTLEPLLTLAVAAHQTGSNCYDYQASGGASLRQAVNFLVPFCDGSATHAEWVNSSVPFDSQRAAAGESKFSIGANFEPRDALRVLRLAAFFDPGLEPLVARLANRRAAVKFAVWQSVLNEAMRL